MGVLSWIFFGLIAGAFAKYFIPGKEPGGYFITSVVGVVAAVAGGMLGTRLGYGSPEDFNLHSQLLAIVSAAIVLVLFRLHEEHKP